MSIDVDVAIVGAGPVGLFAIFQAGMLGMKVCVIDTLPHIGGQCSAMYPEKPIYDIPGYPAISAQALVDALATQASPFTPLYLLDQRVIVANKSNNGFMLKTSKNNIVKAKLIIIAAGCGAFGPKKPDIVNIDSYESKTVFYSVTDRNMFTNKKVLIAGGGDSAIDWGINLSDIANKIYLIHRREKFRCTPRSLERIKKLEKEGKIELIVPYQLHDIEGEGGKITNVIARDLKKNLRIIHCDFLLPFYGLSMELGPIRNWGLNLDKNHIKVDASYYQTNIEGIYAVGDIATYPGKLKLILTGFAEVASALHHAYGRVFDGKALHFQYSTSTGVKKIS